MLDTQAKNQDSQGAWVLEVLQFLKALEILEKLKAFEAVESLINIGH